MKWEEVRASDSLLIYSSITPTQAQQSMMSSHDRAGAGSLRRQPTYPPTGPSHSYRLHEASLFGSASSLYAYPASAALASVSQAVDQLHNSAGSSCSSSSRHVRTAGPYSASLSLLQKNSVMGVMCPTSAAYQQQLSAQSYQRSAAYPLSQRKLNQFPYLWGPISNTRLVWFDMEASLEVYSFIISFFYLITIILFIFFKAFKRCTASFKIFIHYACI